MIENILSRLDKVRRTGPDRWIACCPAHEDRSPSLAIRECDDGRILCRCFAECSFESIVAAVGLDMAEWFPPSPIEPVKSSSRPFPAADVLAVLADETMIVAVAASRVAKGFELTAEDKERLLLAASRIEAGRSAGLGQR